MALIETVPASIRNASHSRSWSRNWRSAGAMITMGRGGSLMNAAGHDQRTRKSSPAQMASSIAPGRDKRFKPQYWLAAKCWELEIGKAAERLNQAGSRQGLPSTLKRLFG
jgi:hypothetical protein